MQVVTSAPVVAVPTPLTFTDCRVRFLAAGSQLVAENRIPNPREKPAQSRG